VAIKETFIKKKFVHMLGKTWATHLHFATLRMLVSDDDDGDDDDDDKDDVGLCR